ncbi:MAG: hypothetical protein PHU23_18350 [Dehalococcoidales bacterium]|nr:hypothetical protein [Dehalococcoidales bacterium]
MSQKLVQQLMEILNEKWPEEVKVSSKYINDAVSQPELPFNICPLDRAYCNNKLLCDRCYKYLNRRDPDGNRT